MKKTNIIKIICLIICVAFGLVQFNCYAIKYNNSIKTEYLDPYDINNYKRSINFCGYTFKVKDSSLSPTGTLGPNNNVFSDSKQDVYVDKNGNLILTLKNKNGVWRATEVVSQDNFGYGKYIFKIASKTDELDENVTFSPFLYKDDNNEIDIEFSNLGTSNTHFIVQPAKKDGNLKTYTTKLNGSYSSYVLDYQPEYIKFESYHGHDVNNKSNQIESWIYTGEDIPDPQDMRLIFNLYLNNGKETSDNKPVKVTVKSFEYIK